MRHIEKVLLPILLLLSVIPLYADVYKQSMTGATTPGSGLFPCRSNRFVPAIGR